MPRTEITVEESAGFGAEIDSVTLTPADQANGMMFANDGRTILVLLNAGAAPINVTVKSVSYQGMTGDKTVTVPGSDPVYDAGPPEVLAVNGLSAAGPFPRQLFNQTTGMVHLDFAADTDLYVACLRMKNPSA